MKTLAVFLALVSAFGGPPALADAASLEGLEPIHMPRKGDGWDVSGGVVQDQNGDLYGLVKNSSTGRFINKYERGCGMVFRIDGATGRRTTLHDFSSHDRSQGCRVYGKLALYGNSLYGVTLSGGAKDHGTVYRLSPGKGHQLLHSFSGTDGSLPGDGLTLGADGNLYGVTFYGGAHDVGTVFRITPFGRFELLHSFDRESEIGYSPARRLTAGPDGALYGVAGSRDTIYRVGLDGTVSLVRQLQPADGCLPQVLTLGSDGWLYGAALVCGQYGQGTLYRVQPDGRFERLHAFSGPDVGMPKEQLTEGADSTWYGIAIGDGGNPPRTVYKIRFDGGAPVPLHVFDDSRWRGHPNGPLLLASDGWLYGTSADGGNTKGPEGIGTGMVFRLAP